MLRSPRRRGCIEEELDVFVGNVEAGGVEVFDGWQIADGGFMGAGFTVGAIEDPFEDADVFAVAWPDELSVVVFAEPVDGVDLRQLVWIGGFAHVEPVLDVITDVVADEWQHGEWVAAHFAELVGMMAAVTSLPMMEPRKTPCCQLKLS